MPPNQALRPEVLDALARMYRAMGRFAEADEAGARAAILRTMR
jgi:hypothetical protein